MKCYYGCDVCQDVCPANQKNYEYLEEFDYLEDSSLSLVDIVDLTNEEFARKYDNKAFNWIPVKRMIRNLLVLEANNHKLSIKDIELYQKKFYNIDWLIDHLTYLKGRIQHGNH
jgi:epoxyqueuosine reductase QueG